MHYGVPKIGNLSIYKIQKFDHFKNHQNLIKLKKDFGKGKIKKIFISNRHIKGKKREYLIIVLKNNEERRYLKKDGRRIETKEEKQRKMWEKSPLSGYNPFRENQNPHWE